MSGARIIKAVEEAARGDFSRITTHGQVWVRDGVDKAEAWDAVIAARRDEREKCAMIAEVFSDQGRDGHQIAKAIRAQRTHSPQASEDVPNG